MINSKTWNPAQIDQAIRRLEGIIRSGSYNPAELNQILNQLGEPGYINTWNPAELDQKLRTLLHDLLSWKTATGNPIQLRTNNGGLVKSCEVSFTPIQSGSGDPAPDNVRPISGWGSVDLYHAGVNLANTTIYKQGYVLGSDGSESVNANYCITDKCIVTGGKRYVLRFKENSGTLSDTSIRIGWYKSNGDFISRTVSTNNTPYVIAPANTEYCKLSYVNNSESENYKWDIMLNEGETALDYVPYQGSTHTATFDNTEYGGSYDFVSGKGKSEWAYIASYDGETITEPWISSIDAYVPETTPSTGAEVCYKLATPITITLTPEEIELLTDNVLWTDGDSIEITYKKLLLPSDVEELSKSKKIKEKPKTTRSKKKKEE